RWLRHAPPCTRWRPSGAGRCALPIRNVDHDGNWLTVRLRIPLAVGDRRGGAALRPRKAGAVLAARHERRTFTPDATLQIRGARALGVIMCRRVPPDGDG